MIFILLLRSKNAVYLALHLAYKVKACTEE